MSGAWKPRGGKVEVTKSYKQAMHTKDDVKQKEQPWFLVYMQIKKKGFLKNLHPESF